jgi:DNA repair exonuclease SbcCD ATPase subunit
MLFTLTINNFRNLSDATYNFERGVTLLKGISGTGKTTIFAAIDWCLYGKGKNVKPLNSRKSKKIETVVIFNSDTLTITRKNNPETLSVRVKDSNGFSKG